MKTASSLGSKKLLNSDKSEVDQEITGSEEEFEEITTLILEKRYKQAKTKLVEILKKDVKNRPARELLARVNKHQKVKNFRAVLIVATLLSVLLIVFLCVAKVWSTEVVVKLATDEISFVIDEKWEVHSIATPLLGISHLDDLELSFKRIERAINNDLRNDLANSWRTLQLKSPLRMRKLPGLELWNVAVQSSYLKLSTLTFQPGAQITITKGANQNEFRINALRAEVFGTIETNDTLMLSCNGCQVESLNDNDSAYNFRMVTAQREIEFNDREQSLNLTLSLPEIKPLILGKSIAISKIDFTKEENNKRTTTIQGNGLIRFSEIDGKEVSIEEGDFLTLGGLGEFRIKRLYIGDRIQVVLQGQVEELKTGAESFMYSRLPTYAEWLRANQIITILAALGLPILSIILAIIYRIEIVDDF